MSFQGQIELWRISKECNNWGGKRTKNDQQTYLNQLDAKEKCIHKDALFIMQQMGDNSRVADVSAGHDVVDPKQTTLVDTVS